MKISKLEGRDITNALTQLNKISEQFKVKLVLSVTLSMDELPEFARAQVLG